MTSLVTDNNSSTESERRRLRQEQDAAYQAALKQDQETERKKLPENKIRFRLDNMKNSVPQEIPYKYLQQITNTFSKSNILGEGAFGKVYNGYDSKNFPSINFAIKKLNEVSNESIEQARKKQNRSFQHEIDILSKFTHPNIVQLVGYSKDNKKGLCLIYTRGERGSLEQLLCDDERVKNELFWKVRLKIVVGLAKAFNYLHRHDPNRVAGPCR